MSTRALYTFTDKRATVVVYKHGDGYPSGVAEQIAKALKFAWALPRFEASDFGAALVAANKTPGGGSLYLCSTGDWKEAGHWDCEYRYDISATEDRLRVQAWTVHHDDEAGVWSEHQFYDGDLGGLEDAGLEEDTY